MKANRWLAWQHRRTAEQNFLCSWRYLNVFEYRIFLSLLWDQIYFVLAAFSSLSFGWQTLCILKDKLCNWLFSPNRVLQYHTDWPQTIDLPASASWMMLLQVCPSIPSNMVSFKMICAKVASMFFHIKKSSLSSKRREHVPEPGVWWIAFRLNLSTDSSSSEGSHMNTPT